MPGTVIRERSQRVSRTLPTDTGVYFLAGLAERGRSDIVHRIRNMAEFEKYIGKRVSYSLAWDMADLYFAEGGSDMRFARVFGPAPVTASANALDAGAAVSFTVQASSPGDWGNLLNFAIEAGSVAGEFKVRITHDTDTTINELSPSFATAADAISYYSTHDLVRLVAGASSNDPAIVATTSLSGGTDDRSNAVDDNYAAALARFDRDLGPGQVGYVGRTTSVAHQQLSDHAENANRTPLYDPPDTTSKGTLTAAISAIKAFTNIRRGGMFSPWLDLPGLVPGASARPVPPSAAVAGVIARNDSQGRSPNEPSAGDLGILSYPVAIRATYSDSDAQELNDLSVNLIRNKIGQFKIYGFRAAVDKTSYPLHWQLANQRLYMAVAAQANNILERFVFRQIDGRKLVFKELEGQLAGMLGRFYEKGSFYGATPDAAFFIDTDTVNTPTTINNGEINATIELTMSPMGETVTLNVVRRQVTA